MQCTLTVHAMHKVWYQYHVKHYSRNCCNYTILIVLGSYYDNESFRKLVGWQIYLMLVAWVTKPILFWLTSQTNTTKVESFTNDGWFAVKMVLTYSTCPTWALVCIQRFLPRHKCSFQSSLNNGFLHKDQLGITVMGKKSTSDINMHESQEINIHWQVNSIKYIYCRISTYTYTERYGGVIHR